MDEQEEIRDFFVSYNKRDRKWGVWIAWELENAGFSVYLQAWDFLAGTNFGLHIQKATSHSRRTIAVLSEDYLKADFTQAEWAAAFVEDPTGIHGKLLPVRVRKCELTGVLKPIIYIDLVGLSETDARKQLLSNLDIKKRNKPDVAPDFPGQTQSKKQSLMKSDPLLPERPPYPPNLPSSTYGQ